METASTRQRVRTAAVPVPQEEEEQQQESYLIMGQQRQVPCRFASSYVARVQLGQFDVKGEEHPHFSARFYGEYTTTRFTGKCKIKVSNM